MTAETVPPHIAPTLGHVAQAFDRSLSSVKQWRATGMPGPPWDIAAIEAWLAAQKRHSGPHAARVREAKAVAAEARAERQRIRTALVAGDVLSADDLQVRLAIAVAPLLERLDTIVAAIGAHWFGKQSTPDLLRMVHELIREPFADESCEKAILAVADRIRAGKPLVGSSRRRRKP